MSLAGGRRCTRLGQEAKNSDDAITDDGRGQLEQPVSAATSAVGSTKAGAPGVNSDYWSSVGAIEAPIRDVIPG